MQFAEATVIILAISAISGLLGIAASGYGWYLSRQKTHHKVESNKSVELPTEAPAPELVAVRAD